MRILLPGIYPLLPACIVMLAIGIALQAATTQRQSLQELAAAQQALGQRQSEMTRDAQQASTRETTLSELKNWRAAPEIAPWPTQLAQIQESLRLPGMHYAVQEVPLAQHTDWYWHAIDLKLQLSLLHEEDLLHFVDQLTVRGGHRWQLEHCYLAPRLEEKTISPFPLIVAECRIRYLELRHRV